MESRRPRSSGKSSNSSNFRGKPERKDNESGNVGHFQNGTAALSDLASSHENESNGACGAASGLELENGQGYYFYDPAAPSWDSAYYLQQDPSIIAFGGQHGFYSSAETNAALGLAEASGYDYPTLDASDPYADGNGEASNVAFQQLTSGYKFNVNAKPFCFDPKPKQETQSSASGHRGGSDSKKNYKNGGNRNKKENLSDAQEVFRSRIQKQLKSDRKLEYENQREALIDQLISNTYECMVCCANVYRREETWSCTNCFHIFHLSCVKKWSSTSAVDNTWRCPGCQNIVENFPRDYYCFCGKTRNPPASSGTPHSCMAVCGRKNGTRADCTHSGCGIPCHPGPCPACTSSVKRNCECGKTSAYVQCSSKNQILCGQTCEKLLNCNVHKCTQNCHAGSCNTCAELLTVYCHCGKSSKQVACSAEWNSNQKFSCDIVCDKLLNCSKHHCPQTCCAPGSCKPCPTSVDVVLSCPCGQTSIEEACRFNKIPIRSSCLDPIPTCDKICRRILPCGGNEKHFCQEKCHVKETRCPPCNLITGVTCRCGNQQLEVPCTEFLSSAEFLCQKKCTKKRRCGKHKCNTRCCADLEHICPIVCNRQLKCPHKCELLCHMGYCPPCRNTSFEELRCECGEAVIYPPVACGTLPPACNKPCTREHACEHPPTHTCHSDPECPPCTFLTSKWCFGNHELRKTILCHVTQVSCGMPCNKDLNCSGGHKCAKICHGGPCRSERDVCQLPCLMLRKCGHKCGAPCHEEGKCPDTKCKVLVPVTCKCGRREEVMLCWKQEALEAGKKPDPSTASSSDANGGSGEDSTNNSLERKRRNQKVLECDKECARADRLRKMAEALQLDNPDPETRLGPPKYSEFLKKFAQKNPQFVEMVHTKLSDLVLKAKKDKRKNVTYPFDSMNREKRTVVHEYSDHFGCASESFDEEPHRNVMVTASKDKSYLPSDSLVNVVFGKTVKTERKNVYEDLELSAQPKSHIIVPSLRKLVPARTSAQNPGMVPLNGAGAWGKH